MLDVKIAQKILDKYSLGKLNSFYRHERGITGTVFDVNDKFIIKIQSDASDQVRSERNAFICTLLTKHEIPAPELVALDVSKEIMPEKYVIMTKLKGENLKEFWQDWPKEAQKEIFFEYGRLMARFHQIKMAHFGDPVDPNHQFDNWRDCVLTRYQRYANYLQKNKVVPMETLGVIDKFFSANDDLLKINVEPVLTHNDFQSKNLKFLNGELIGIFDFDECLMAHNELDFTKTCLPFKKEKVWLDEIIRGYLSLGSISEEFPLRIKLYTLKFCLKVLMFLHINGLSTPLLKNKFLWAIDKILTEDWKFFDHPEHLWK